MRILTNFDRFPDAWVSETGQSGSSETAKTLEDFLNGARRADLLMINCDVGVTLRLCAAFLMRPWRRKPIIAVDFVLRKPRTLSARISVWIKRLLLSRVDLFIHYFNDLSGYEKYYGIGRNRSLFVPFKPNIRYRFDPSSTNEGKYLLCLGRSMRDYDTFFDAVAGLPWPAAIPAPDFPELRRNESRFTRSLDRLPPNVTLLEDNGTEESMFRILGSAKIVVLPIRKASLCASGVSTYLNAMLMRKCVVLTEGPGVSDVLTGQALICASEDPALLASTIRKAWEDDGLRQRLEESGYRYALSLGGEPELLQRIIDASCRFLAQRGGNRPRTP
ncbi:MAG TPA: glycosyltransferase [Bryobacteraceae bacterium]|nr:glycosyltransferase [Bryobacteraceae bacterium]